MKDVFDLVLVFIIGIAVGFFLGAYSAMKHHEESAKVSANIVTLLNPL